MSDLRRVVLHIGMGKTGSSSIQAVCHRNRDLLARHGVLYPASPGQRRHTRLGLAMHDDSDSPRQSVDWRRQPESQPSELRPVMEAGLAAEIAASDTSHVLLSDESLLIAEPGVLRRLRRFLDTLASHVRVVVYLRRQDDHLCSRYQQRVKLAGETRRLVGRLAQDDLERVYDYHARLAGWRELVRPDQLIVRTFERSRLTDAGTTLEADFLAAAGIDLSMQNMIVPPPRNESLDAESVEFLRLLNLWHAEQGERPAVKPRRTVVRRLQRRHESGPTLTLPPDTLNAFMAQWLSSNAAVARDFAPDAPPSLFVDDRKTRGTTTEQRLDPGRLAHFLEITRLPEEQHAALRRIAEREARE